MMPIVGGTDRIIAGRYRVDRDLWSGPYSRSLLVTDLRNGRPCVLRQLSLAQAPPAAARRFEAQAAILAKLDYPGLPRFIDGFFAGEGETRERVVVTSYHPGESLERLVAKGRPLTEAQALMLLRRLVPVLVYLHGFEPPLVHRAIGAKGIIVGPDGRPCLTDLDFSIAELAAPSGELAPPGPDEIALAAPEVFTGGAIPASDIYALGLAIIRGMTEQDPALLLHEVAKPRLRTALGISEAFAAVLARMLDSSLERRYTDAQALEVDLARLAGVRVVAPQQPERTAVERRPKVRAAAAVPQQQDQAGEEPRPQRWGRTLAVAAGVLAIMVLAAVAVRVRTRPTAGETSLLVPAAPPERASGPARPAAEGVAPAPPPDAAAEPNTTLPLVPPAAITIPATATVPATASSSASPSAPAPASQSAPAAALVPPPQTDPAAVSAPPAPALSPAIPQADLPPVVVQGRLLFGGRPFANPAAPAPTFWFREEGAKAAPKPQVDVAAGAFTVRGLKPGRYGVSVRVDLERSNPNIFPGDLNGWSEFALEAGRVAALDVPLRTVLHLQQPVDNGVVIKGWEVPCAGGDAFSAPVVFSWEALGAGVSYQVSVDRLVCGRGYATAGRVFTRSTTENRVEIQLPPNRGGECYSFRLTATKEGLPVGILATHGKTDLGWNYRFTVKK